MDKAFIEHLINLFLNALELGQCVQQPAPSELLGSERELGPPIESLAVRCTKIGKLAVRYQRNFLIRQIVEI